jgi:1,4-dihydroxy-2-naphthoate polyprenyltransferase
MRRATWLTFGLALALGLLLVAWGGWGLIAVGVACVLSAAAYTGGPWPLGYYGLGDLFVFIFFGLVAVCVTYYVQAGRITGEVVLAASAIGLLTMNILLVNNYRDAETDRRAGKHTLVVRMGKRFALGQFAVCHLGACVIVVMLARAGLYGLTAGWLVAAILATYGFLQWRALRDAREPGEMIALLGWCGAYVGIYALTLSLLVLSG